MPTVTRFKTINDEQKNIVLPAGKTSVDFEFDLVGLEEATKRDPAVLGWVVDTEVSGQQLEVTLNKIHQTLTAKLPGDAYQTLHEIVPGDILIPKGNTVTFTVTGSNGVMRISDVVLWWQYRM
jgi:hypothetical protein